MKGLLVKDFKILMNQKKFMIMFFFVAIVLSFSMDSSFIVSYISMIGTILTLSTISFDYQDEGYSFLMTLPIRRGDYAIGKYAFTVLGLACFWGISLVLQFASFFIRGTEFDLTETLLTDICMLPLFIFVAAVLIPIEIKFSPEKVRVVMFLFFGIVLVIAMGGKALLEKLQDNTGIEFVSKLETLDAVNPLPLIMGVLAISIIMLSISMIISVRIMEKREF
jgi:hypothetical protein